MGRSENNGCVVQVISTAGWAELAAALQTSSPRDGTADRGRGDDTVIRGELDCSSPRCASLRQASKGPPRDGETVNPSGT